MEFTSGPDWTLARFRMACTPSWRKGGEWVSGDTLWVTVRASGQTAVNVRDSVRKGDPLIVVGRLRNHIWKDVEGKMHEAEQIEALSLGHDLARGVSTFIRPARVSSRYEDGPLVPDGLADPPDEAPEDPADLAEDGQDDDDADPETEETTPV